MADIEFDPVTGEVVVKSVIPPSPTTSSIITPASFTPPSTDDSGKVPEAKPEVTAISHSMGIKDADIKETLVSALESIAIGDKLMAKKTDIINVFKRHGMDTMSQNKAWDELSSILTLE
jgi:hypothetical protein